MQTFKMIMKKLMASCFGPLRFVGSVLVGFGSVFGSVFVGFGSAALIHQAPDFGRTVLNHVQEVAEVLAELAALALLVLQREPADV